MRIVNMLDAKTNLSRLVDAVETGEETEVIIARNGKPAARLVPLEARQPVVLGLGKHLVPDTLDPGAPFSPEIDAEVMALFTDSAIELADLMDEAVVLDPRMIKSSP
jgi:prevent-host-death family protein